MVGEILVHIKQVSYAKYSLEDTWKIIL